MAMINYSDTKSCWEVMDTTEFVVDEQAEGGVLTNILSSGAD